MNLRASQQRKAAWAGLVAMVLATKGVHAAPKVDAQAIEELKQGYAFRERGQCKEAIAHFEASIARQPSVKGYLNRAACEEALGKDANAYASYVLGRDLAAAEGPPELREYADEHLRATKQKVALITVTVEPNTELRLDDAPATPGTVPLDPGEHTFLALSEGRAPNRVTLRVRAGETRSVSVARGPVLMNAPTATGSNGGTRASTTGMHPLRSAGFGAIAGSVVAAGVGTFLVLGAKADYDDARTAHCAGLQCSSVGVEQVGDARSQANVGTGFFVASGVFAATGLALVLFAPSTQSSVGLGPGGARLTGSF